MKGFALPHISDYFALVLCTASTTILFLYIVGRRLLIARSNGLAISGCWTMHFISSILVLLLMLWIFSSSGANLLSKLFGIRMFNEASSLGGALLALIVHSTAAIASHVVFLFKLAGTRKR